ncbi:MAG: thioesterase family protein [Novosphingobium sp.]|nr:thioesterase family protein [Novosphingobium sp.]
MAGQAQVEKLGDILVPEALGDDRFRMTNTRGGWPRLFGGQIVAQALAAGSATVGEDRLVNSFHAYFLRAGERGTQIECAVERERDGGSFSNRRIVASQNGKAILSMIASWHTGEHGPSRDELPVPQAGPPEDYLSYQDIPSEAAALEPGSPFDILEVRPVIGGRMAPSERANAPGRSLMWIRFRDSHDASPALARLMIAYASDLLMIGTALQPHREDVLGGRPVVASVDHTVRYHADPDVSDWTLFDQHSDWAGEGRTLIRGAMFRRDGSRICSISQEGLLRV